MYCNTFQTKVLRHMCKKHKDVGEVLEYMKLPTAAEKKKAGLLIINKSNGNLNDKILNEEEGGKLIPVRKPTSGKITAESHIMCSNCNGLISKKYYLSHSNSCKSTLALIPTLGKKQKDKTKKEYLCKKTSQQYDRLINKVVNSMKHDSITIQVVSDELILEYGRRFLANHNIEKQRNYIACKMRTLAALVLRIKKTNSEVTFLKDILKPQMFDVLCAAVREWSGYDESTGICKTGSVPRRLFKSLKSCCSTVLSQAIKDDSIDKEELARIQSQHDRFMSLMTSEWPVELGASGDRSVKVNKVTKEDKMPLEEDLVLFFSEVGDIMKKTQASLEDQKSEADFIKLSKMTLAYLVAFNSRRPSEVAYSTESNYSKIEKTTSENGEELGVFKVVATKNDVKVPIIVTHDAISAIDCLLRFKKTFKIKNDFIFSTLEGNPYNGSTVLSQTKLILQLKNPEHFTANGIRHYWATISQLDPTLKSHMPKFLGHTLATHQKFYEMPMADVHLNIIGPKLLDHCKIPLQTEEVADEGLIEDDPQDCGSNNVANPGSSKVKLY